MKTLTTSLILALTLLVVPAAYANTEEVLRATQSLNVEDSEQHFHGQVFLLDTGRPKELIVVVETTEGQEVTSSRCLLERVATKTFLCASDTMTASVRRKRRNGDILNIVVRNYAADFKTAPDLDLTTKVIVNTRVASYQDLWHYHGTTLVNVYRKENP